MKFFVLLNKIFIKIVWMVIKINLSNVLDYVVLFVLICRYNIYILLERKINFVKFIIV